MHYDEIFIERVRRRFSAVPVIVMFPVHADLFIVKDVEGIDESSTEADLIVVVFGPRVHLAFVTITLFLVGIGSIPSVGVVGAVVHGEFVANAMRFQWEIE